MESSKVEVRLVSSQRGMGLVASRDIGVGATLLSERPLILMPSKVFELEDPRDIEVWLDKRINRLSCEERAEYFELSDCRDREEKSVLGIFFTNDMAFGEDSVLCVKMARANHSCHPNADFFARRERGVMELIAISDIKKGEEVCICYLPAANEASDVKHVRQEYIRKWYGFQCDCHACSLKGSAGSADDGVRRSVRVLQQHWRSSDDVDELEHFLKCLRQIGCKPDFELEVLKKLFEVCLAKSDFKMAAKTFVELFMLEAIVEGDHRDQIERDMDKFSSNYTYILNAKMVEIDNQGFLFNILQD